MSAFATTRRTFLGGMAAAAASTAARPRPNLLFVFPDQFRAQALGFLGQDPVVTPSLDAFARQSLVLTHAISNAPVCSPYRAMLMTGRYPTGNGVVRNCTANGEVKSPELRAADTCLPDVLHKAGYATGYIGKWHLDTPHPPYIDTSNNRGAVKWNEWTPPARRHGFDYWHAYGTYDNHNAPQYWENDAPRERRTTAPKWGPEYETDLAIEFLRNPGGRMRKPDRPFALFLAFNPPHTDYRQVPERYLQPYAGKTWRELVNRRNFDGNADTPVVRAAKQDIRYYFAQVTGVDDQFGRLLRTLDETGLAENTIVVFTSDHGNCVGSHNEATKNNPYEESLRVPFLIRWPGAIPPRRDDLLLSVPDIMPSLLGLAGLSEQAPPGVEGTDYSELLRGGRQARPTSALYYQAERNERGVRTARYTLALAGDGNPRRTLLFDNQADPYQLRNLAGERPELVEQLRHDELEPWLRRTGDPWPVRLRLEGPWELTVEHPKANPPRVQLTVPGPDIVAVTGEVYPQLPVFDPKAAAWKRGARLTGVIAAECTMQGALDPASLEVRLTPDGPPLRKGVDYEADLDAGAMGRLAGGAIAADQRVVISYRYARQRLDSVVLTVDGKLALRAGTPHAVMPEAPKLAAGETRVANVFLSGRLDRLNEDLLFPVLETAYPEPKRTGPSIAEGRLPRALAKLRSGEPIKILAWGDSVTTFERYQTMFVNRLRERFPRSRIELVTEAWGGRNTSSYLKEPPGSVHNYQEKVLAVKPDLIVSEFVNDAGLNEQQVEERYSKLLADFRQIGAEWIILTPHYVRPDWMKLNRQRDIDVDPRPYVKGVRLFAERHGIAVAEGSLRYGRLWRQGIPYLTLMDNNINHPNLFGHTLFADALMALFP